jgi:hypothetical protein
MTDNNRNLRVINAANFHDAILESMFVINGQRSTTIELALRVPKANKRGRGRKVVVRLIGSANLSAEVDFDVLRDNSCGQTSYVEADGSAYSATRLILDQRPSLNITYHPDTEHPQDRKLERLNKLAVFRFVLFGGTIEVLAQRVRVKSQAGK